MFGNEFSRQKPDEISCFILVFWGCIEKQIEHLSHQTGLICRGGMWLEQYCPKLFFSLQVCCDERYERHFFPKKLRDFGMRWRNWLSMLHGRNPANNPLRYTQKNQPKITDMFTIFQLIGWIVKNHTTGYFHFSWSARLKSLNFLDNFCIWNDSPHWANRRIQEGLWVQAAEWWLNWNKNLKDKFNQIPYTFLGKKHIKKVEFARSVFLLALKPETWSSFLFSTNSHTWCCCWGLCP